MTREEDIENFLSRGWEKTVKELIKLFKIIPSKFIDDRNIHIGSIIPLRAYTFINNGYKKVDVNITYDYANSLINYFSFPGSSIDVYHVPTEDVDCTLTEIWRNRYILLKYRRLIRDPKYDVKTIDVPDKSIFNQNKTKRVIYHIPDDLIEDLLDYSLKLTDEKIHDAINDQKYIVDRDCIRLFKTAKKY